MFDHVKSWKVYILTLVFAALGFIVLKESDAWYLELSALYLVLFSVSYNEHINSIFE